MTKKLSPTDIKQTICPGCRQDRYNHKGLCERPGIDAVVTSDNCWHMRPENIQYDPFWKRYYCLAGDNDLCRESCTSEEYGKKMKINHLGCLVDA